MKNKKKIISVILGSTIPILSASAIVSCGKKKSVSNQEKVNQVYKLINGVVKNNDINSKLILEVTKDVSNKTNLLTSIKDALKGKISGINDTHLSYITFANENIDFKRGLKQKNVIELKITLGGAAKIIKINVVKDYTDQEKVIKVKFDAISQEEIKLKDGININNNILPTKIDVPSSLTIDLNNLKDVAITLSKIMKNDGAGTISYIAKLKYEIFKREIVVQYPLNSFKKQLMTRNSNIGYGDGGSIVFQQKNGTLWSMSYGSTLQYFDGEKWVSNKTRINDYHPWRDNPESGKTRGSNIMDGRDGVIFEDKDETLWSMGNGTPLQYFDKINQIWKNDTKNGKTKGSNIINGYEGVIFEDSGGTLWSMGNDTPLQYFDGHQWVSNKIKNDRGEWIDNPKPGKTLGSNIMDGQGGVIFEDKDKTLWSMGYSTRKKNASLQYFDGKKWISNITNSNKWDYTKKSGKTINSKIWNGYNGVIFQSKDRTIWAMSMFSSLQYFDGQKWVTNKIKNDNGESIDNPNLGKIKGSNIINGYGGTIFETKDGTLWSMGFNTPLQYFDGHQWVSNKIKNDRGEWIDNPKPGKTRGSNIINGRFGVIFEDWQGTLWSMGQDTPLQYFDKKEKTWKNDKNSGKTKGSNINRGGGGIIWEDKNGILWSMGTSTRLQYFDGQSWISATW